jgi:type VI secretion system protein
MKNTHAPALSRLPGAIALLALLFSLAGCGAMDWLQNALYPKSDLEQLRIVAAPDANQGMATALDLVFVYDKSAILLLPKSGPEWFDKKKSIVANQPANFVVVSLEVPPGMIVDAPLPKRSGQPMGAFLYANYLGRDGQFPLNLTSFTAAEIRLKAQAIEYVTVAGGKPLVTTP